MTISKSITIIEVIKSKVEVVIQIFKKLNVTAFQQKQHSH